MTHCRPLPSCCVAARLDALPDDNSHASKEPSSQERTLVKHIGTLSRTAGKMDIKHSIHVAALVLAFSMQHTNAETATALAPAPEPATQDALPEATIPASGAAAVATTTAQVWNKSKIPIVVSQKGLSQKIEPTQSYNSESYPQVPINILLPDNSPSTVKYITVTGQKGACTVPVCIFVQ